MFYHRLAARLGRTVPELLASVSAAELGEWEAYDTLEPLDTADRFEQAIAQVCVLLFNANRDPNKSEAATIDDFLPHWGQLFREAAGLRAMSPDQVRAAMARFRGK